jgi:YVTN family beta-propeller protein
MLLRKLAVLLLAALAVPAFGKSINHPTGTQGLLLIDKLGGQIRFADPVTYKELSSFAVPKNPHDFVLTADHSRAYVTIYGAGVYGKNPEPDHRIYVIDMAKQAVADVIDIAPYRAPHGIQIDNSGLIYVASDLDRKLLVIDPAKKSILAAIDTEGTGHWIGMLPDGSKMYVTNKNDKPFISVIDLKARKMVGRIPAPNGTQGVAVSPDGSRVVVMDFKDPVLIVIDPATDQVIDRIPLKDQTGGAYKAYYSPDGSKLLTIAGSTVTIFDAANLRGPQLTAKVGANPMGFAFSTDGKTALVANHGDGTISVIDLATAKVAKTWTAGTGIETLGYY